MQFSNNFIPIENQTQIMSSGFIQHVNGKAVHLEKTWKDLYIRLLYPIFCTWHPDYLCPTIEKCPGRQEGISNGKIAHHEVPLDSPTYTVVNLEDSRKKIFISGSNELTQVNWGHIWQDYYYHIFNMLFGNEDLFKDASVIVLCDGRDLDAKEEKPFNPGSSYFKSFTELLFKSYGAKSVEFIYENCIIRADNFTINKDDLILSPPTNSYDKMQKWFSINFVAQKEPFRKVYARKDYCHGAPYSKSNSEVGYQYEVVGKINQIKSTDKGFDNIYESIKSNASIDKRIFNELELIDFLESNGWECWDPAYKFHSEECVKQVIAGNRVEFPVYTVELNCNGKCLLEDNINYFREIKSFMSVSASSLANMTFMNPGCNIIQLRSKYYYPFAETTKKIKDIWESYGSIDQSSAAVEEFLKSNGEIHPWHEKLANGFNMNYFCIDNDTFNARDILKKIKSDENLLRLISS